ncbi:hypothetical protein D3C83_33820 [compost metagenome]
MQEARARNMRPRVGAAPGFVIGEIVSAIADDPVRIIEMRGQIRDAYEGVVGHENPPGRDLS